jgi:D-aminopeptidase
LESSLKRGRKVESEVDELHHQLRNSDESKLHNEISLLKGKIIELEAMLSSERHEKDLLMQEKENYRGSANKLVSGFILNVIINDTNVTHSAILTSGKITPTGARKQRCYKQQKEYE